MMNILMIAPQPFFQPRGTPISVLHRLRTLSRLGHQVDLLTYHIGQDVDFQGVRIFRIVNVPFIKKIDVGPSRNKIVLDALLFAKALRKLLFKKYDVIHSHEEAGFFATVLAKLFGTLHLYDMHSSLPQQLFNFKFTKSRLLITAFEKLEQWTINNADAVITICPELHEYVKTRFPDKYEVLIENVADNNDVFDASSGSAIHVKKKYHLDGKVIVLYTGTFEPYQGLDLLIQSSEKILQCFKDVSFLLVGGHPQQVEEYRKMVRAKALEPYFVFTGMVAPQEIPRFIEFADVLVSPRIEGNNTPLKIYSYLRSGKPIVATNHITHTQVLNDDVAILTECTPEAFAQGLTRVLEDESLRKTIGAKAQKLAEEKYSYHSYLAKTKSLYEFLEKRIENR